MDGMVGAGQESRIGGWIAVGAILLLLAAAVSGCSNTLIDPDSARITLNEQRRIDSIARYHDSLRQRDSVVFTDSLRRAEERRLSDSIRQARELALLEAARRADSILYTDSLRGYDDSLRWLRNPARISGKIYFDKPQAPRASADLQVDPLSRIDIRFDTVTGVPVALRLRVLANIPEQPAANNGPDGPSFIYLNALVAVYNGKGGVDLVANPAASAEARDSSGLGVLYRESLAGDFWMWLATNSYTNRGEFIIESIDPVTRVIEASLSADFTAPLRVSISRISLRIEY